MLEGYEYEFVANVSKDPGTRKYNGIVNPALLGRLQEFAPDAVLVNGWNFKSHLQCLRYFHGKIPVWFRGDSTLLDQQTSFKQLARKMILTWVFKHVDIALHVGTANKAYFKSYGLPEKQLLFAPHAVDNIRFAAKPRYLADAAELTTSLGIDPDAIIFLFAGKLEPKKDPLLLLSAFKNLQQYPAQLIFVGNGVLEEMLKKEAAGATNIHFLDFQNQQQMPAVYAMADVFILPSKGPGETWGLAVNEAMAAGKAVLVSTACGCVQDLVNDGVNGWIFTAGDAADLQKKMQAIPADKSALAEMGKNGSKKIHSFSFEKIALAIEAGMG